MKQVTLLLMLSTLCFSSGCGVDGRDGTSYLALDWDWYVDLYWDDNPDIPNKISRLKEYRVNPNKYSFEYICSDGLGDVWGYEGTYTIRQNNRGESASLFRNGDDGKNRHHVLFLGGSHSSLSVDERSFPQAQKELKTQILKQPLAIAASDRVYIGEPVVEILTHNSMEITVSKRMFRFKH